MSDNKGSVIQGADQLSDEVNKFSASEIHNAMAAQPQDLFGKQLSRITTVYALGEWWSIDHKGTAPVIERGNLRFHTSPHDFDHKSLNLVLPLKEVRGIQWR